jgi:hypothetical protein
MMTPNARRTREVDHRDNVQPYATKAIVRRRSCLPAFPAVAHARSRLARPYQLGYPAAGGRRPVTGWRPLNSSRPGPGLSKHHLSVPAARWTFSGAMSPLRKTIQKLGYPLTNYNNMVH